MTNPIGEELLAKIQAAIEVNSIGGTETHPVVTADGLVGDMLNITELRDRRAADSRDNQAVVTEEMVERAYEAFVAACEWADWDEPEVRGYVRAALTAALSRAEEQEPVAYLHKPTGNVIKATEFRPLLSGWQQQFADTHAPEEIEADFLPLYRSALVKAPAPAVPDGWKLVPEQMKLDATAVKDIAFMCDTEEGGILWVGKVTDDTGAGPVYGLNIASAEYPEEGSTTLVEFPAPSQPLVRGEGE